MGRTLNSLFEKGQTLAASHSAQCKAKQKNDKSQQTPHRKHFTCVYCEAAGLLPGLANSASKMAPPTRCYIQLVGFRGRTEIGRMRHLLCVTSSSSPSPILGSRPRRGGKGRTGRHPFLCLRFDYESESGANEKGANKTRRNTRTRG
ncbi:UDP-phosphate galactose phosphotransferase [Anopheles sinensis]|uniref:UDP-phosphate galactose phosphotransferase n=1 Tax=Anopheles sinensis TaxID=74873 RepID=A0A084VVE7_ANOSI|nr:UDP-phosphate galactose phosphotransferase [Anopheles sinensis]